MKKHLSKHIFLLIVLIFIFPGLIGNWQPDRIASAQVLGNDVLYTTGADFDLGTLISVNHDAPLNDQLQLDSPTEPFPFINVAASGRGTVVRANTETGQVVGEYRTAPDGRGLNPSRTTVDLFGNVWTANRAEVDPIDSIPHGSAVKIGLIVGGTRVDAGGAHDPNGGYLAPPFGYNTCVDRDNDGLIRTSSGLGDLLAWPDVTDGQGGVDGLVQDAEDECILIYQRLYDAEQARHVSVDASNNVWVGGYPFELRMFYKLDGVSGAILDSFDARDIGCGGYGGLIDGNGVLWSVGGDLLRYDPATRSGFCIRQGGYGLGIDTDGYIWMSIWDGGIVKIAPDGTIVPGFPKPTYPPSMTMTSSLAVSKKSLMKMLPPRNEVVPRTATLTNGDPVTFQVAPVDDWVSSSSAWTPGATISLNIADGSGVVYSDTQTADDGGNFNFDLWDVFDLQRGQVVTVFDGTYTKTHTVMDLYVDGVDVTADTVFGRADPASSVNIWVHGDGNLTVTPDSLGNWVADFSGTTDLTYLSDGGSSQTDDDGDSTGVWWASPKFQAAPVDDWVSSSSAWTPGATISLIIADGGTEVYSDTQIADDNGNFNFEFRDEFDLQRGQVVTISDGKTTKIHTVVDLYVDGVNVIADTVFGRADPNATVEVWVHGYGRLTATSDGSGDWSADFLGMTDLTYLSDGGSSQSDNDGDSTGVWWAGPRFQVAPEGDWVQSLSAWSSGATITLTIEDATGVVYSDSRIADAEGNFNFELWDVFDVERGHAVTVSDGLTTKTHTVTDLYVNGVDVTEDTVFGQAEAGSVVDVWVHGAGGLTVTVDGAGNWTADFSAMTDLTYHSDGGSAQTDDNGDSTGVWWEIPRFQVVPEDDWVGSSNRWRQGTSISLTIADDSGVLYSDSQTTDAEGNFNFELWDVFDLQRGQTVTVSDGMITKTHTVMDLYVDGVDLAADTVFGRANYGTSVDVWVHGDGGVTTTADGSGQWTANFSGTIDLTGFSDGGSEQVDEDGDSTAVWWVTPRFQVAPEDDWVQSWNRWRPGTTITLTIREGGVEAYSATQMTDLNGNFHFSLWDVFDLQRGQVVTISDGTTTKTHTVKELFVDGVDLTADTVFGRADPGTSVNVWVHDDGNLSATADNSGKWVANFSGMADLNYLSDGGSEQVDEDGDGTGVWWAHPSFEVTPEDGRVGSWNRWRPGATISLTVEEGGAEVYSDTRVADNNGNFWFDSFDFELVTDQVVTVSDGTITKSHTVIDIEVNNIDIENDQVHGTANPGAQVSVWASLFDNGSNRRVTADSSGNWMANFSVSSNGQPIYDIINITRIDVSEFDEDGDATRRRFGPPAMQNRGVAVTPIDNHVWIANSGYGTVTRLDKDGNILNVIDTGEEPTGVAVDSTGKVWATNMSSHTAVRIDPIAGSDGLGAVDLTVDLGKDAWPYNYSDMTGAVVVGSTSPQGFWSVIQDSETPGFEWGRISWNNEPEGSEPPGTDIVVEARAADSEAGLGGQPFQPVFEGDLFSMFGRFIEVRATLKASPDNVSPVLSDIHIQPHVIYVDIDIKPGSYPNSINCKNRKEVIAVAVLTSEEFDAMTIDHSTVSFEGAAEIHVDKKTGEPHRHVEDVDQDGDLDLVFHFRFSDTALTCESTEGILLGQLYDEIPIEGTDTVRMITR